MNHIKSNDLHPYSQLCSQCRQNLQPCAQNFAPYPQINDMAVMPCAGRYPCGMMPPYAQMPPCAQVRNGGWPQAQQSMPFPYPPTPGFIPCEFAAFSSPSGQAVQPGEGIVFEITTGGSGTDIQNIAGSSRITLAGGHAYFVMATVSSATPQSVSAQLQMNGRVLSAFAGYQTALCFAFVNAPKESEESVLQIVNAGGEELTCFCQTSIVEIN